MEIVGKKELSGNCSMNQGKFKMNTFMTIITNGVDGGEKKYNKKK